MFAATRAQLRHPLRHTSRSGEEHVPVSRRVEAFSLKNCWKTTKLKKRLLLLCSAIVLAYAANNRYAYRKRGTQKWVKMPIIDIERPCPAPDYPVIGENSGKASAGKICITTLTDEKKADLVQRLVRWRSFDNLLGMTWQNKQDYANKHGYHLFDGSDLLDTSRPPSWSKILAVRRLLVEEACDWVFWLDADTVIMNSDKKIESFLPSEEGKDLLLTEHTKGFGGWNAGVWVIRNTEWSLRFLDRWWNMKSYVKVKGLDRSGDNSAFNNYLKPMDKDYFEEHIVVPEKCHLNSGAQFLTVAEAAEIERSGTLEKQEWYMNLKHYHKGDLIAHPAGYDNKIDTIAVLLKHAT